MIIKSYEIEKINLLKFKRFLLYGKNVGFQNEVVEQKFISNFNGKIHKIDENEFIVNYDTILDEMLSKSLFEEKKMYIISRVSDKIFKYISEIVERSIDDIFIILKSNILEKKSKIRSFFEKNKNLVTIPFYEDDGRKLLSIVNEYLRENKILLSRESINLVISRANGDRGNLTNELKKIKNYSLSNKDIDLITIQKLTNLTENYDVSELANNFLTKNTKKISKILNENNYSEEDCILILRTILSKTKRLISIKEECEETKNIDQIIDNFKPSIFWKDKEIIKKQVNTWKLRDLKAKMYQINEVETLVKSSSKNSLNLVSDFIINH